MFGFEFNRKQKLALWTLIGLAAIGLSYTHIHNSLSPTPGEVVLYEPGDKGAPRVAASDGDATPLSRNRDAGRIVCHVVGCVKASGVYTLHPGDRIIDAIKAAGGAKPNADLETINLAAKVEDGSRICVPSLEERRVSAAPSFHMAAGGAAGYASASSRAKTTGDKLRTPGEGLVHLNSADAQELQRLPGVGPATAEKIVLYRLQIRRFVRVEQIMDVKGIGPKKYEKMRPFLAL